MIAIVWLIPFARTLMCPMSFLSAGSTSVIGATMGSGFLHLLEKSIGMSNDSKIGAVIGELAKSSRLGLGFASSTSGRPERVIVQGTIQYLLVAALQMSLKVRCSLAIFLQALS